MCFKHCKHVTGVCVCVCVCVRGKSCVRTVVGVLLRDCVQRWWGMIKMIGTMLERCNHQLNVCGFFQLWGCSLSFAAADNSCRSILRRECDLYVRAFFITEGVHMKLDTNLKQKDILYTPCLTTMSLIRTVSVK